MTRHISAAPEVVWALVTDVTSTGRFSPETFDGQWLDGATGPEVGARFRGHVRRNGRKWLVYWTTCTITRCVPGREFAFQVDLLGRVRAVEWTYSFEPREGGTTVTEAFTLLRWFGSGLYEALVGSARTRTNLSNMQMTLERLKEAAESPPGRELMPPA